MKSDKTVVLVGFMGCGKSSVARVLAARMNCEAVDLDTLLVAREGASIAEFFAVRGEAEFRRLETEVLRDVLNSIIPRIVATGGGIVTREENRALLKEASARGVLVVYLEAEAKTLAYRIRRQPGLRPLIDGARVLNLQETQSRVEELLKTRAPLYESVANQTVNVGVLAPDEIARQIISAIEGNFHD